MSTVDDLLALPIPARRHWLASQAIEDPEGLALIFADALRESGTQWIFWRDDPIGFTEDVLGGWVTASQSPIMGSVQKNRRTAVVSAHGAGKSKTAARLIVWFIATHPPGSLALSSAPTFRQVRHILWRYIRTEHSLGGLPGRLNQIDWNLDDRTVAFGFSPSRHDESATQGMHAESEGSLLCVIDEAGGIPSELGRNLDSLMTGDAYMLAIGNAPTDEEDSWFEVIATSDDRWSVITIPAWASPNVCQNPDCRAAIYLHGEPCPNCGAETEPCPPNVARNLVDRRWIDDAIQTYGVDDPYVIARVEAQFPKSASRRTIPPAWVDLVMLGQDPETGEWETDDEFDPGKWIRLGVDVAGEGGDEMVVALADGMTLRILDTWSGAASADQVINAERVMEHIQWAESLQRQRGYNERAVRVKVDEGGPGGGTADELRRLKREGKHTADIIKVNFGSRANDDTRYANTRAELHWEFRELCRARSIRLCIDERAYKQLTVTTYRDNGPGGRIIVESKADLKKRGVQSPDRADALILAVYEPVGVAPQEQSYASMLAEARLPARVGGGRGV